MPSKTHLCLILIVTLGMNGCVSAPKPVVPQAIAATAPSFDGSHADSGVVGTTGEEFIISEYARSRYNSLVLKYGKSAEFIVPIQADAGLHDAPAALVSKHARGKLYLMSAEAMTNFVRMSRWHREGR